MEQWGQFGGQWVGLMARQRELPVGWAADLAFGLSVGSMGQKGIGGLGRLDPQARSGARPSDFSPWDGQTKSRSSIPNSPLGLHGLSWRTGSHVEASSQQFLTKEWKISCCSWTTSSQSSERTQQSHIVGFPVLSECSVAWSFPPIGINCRCLRAWSGSLQRGRMGSRPRRPARPPRYR